MFWFVLIYLSWWYPSITESESNSLNSGKESPSKLIFPNATNFDESRFILLSNLVSLKWITFTEWQNHTSNQCLQHYKAYFEKIIFLSLRTPSVKFKMLEKSFVKDYSFYFIPSYLLAFSPLLKFKFKRNRHDFPSHTLALCNTVPI